MRCSVISSPGSWFISYAHELVELLRSLGTADLYTSHDSVPAGDIAFHLSYAAIVPDGVLSRNRSNVVAHASALPQGKGMSPMTWQVLAGKNEIPLTLFEAVRELDAGPIYIQEHLTFEGNELLPEMQAALGSRIVKLCFEFARRYPAILLEAVPQSGTPSFYRRRTPADSELDPCKSIAEQFDLLRTVDNDRYPAFFKFRNRRYKLTIEVIDESEEA